MNKPILHIQNTVTETNTVPGTRLATYNTNQNPNNTNSEIRESAWFLSQFHQAIRKEIEEAVRKEYEAKLGEKDEEIQRLKEELKEKNGRYDQLLENYMSLENKLLYNKAECAESHTEAPQNSRNIKNSPAKKILYVLNEDPIAFVNWCRLNLNDLEPNELIRYIAKGIDIGYFKKLPNMAQLKDLLPDYPYTSGLKKQLTKYRRLSEDKDFDVEDEYHISEIDFNYLPKPDVISR